MDITQYKFAGNNDKENEEEKKKIDRDEYDEQLD
jgi:hypothetical protein